MEGRQRVDLPSIGERLPFLPAGDGVGGGASEYVALVEIARAVITFKVGAVLGKRAAVGGDVIIAMRPGIRGLSAEVMPVGDTGGRLQRAVIGGSDAFDFVDVSVVRIERIVRDGSTGSEALGSGRGRRLIDVKNGEEMAPFAADIADLEDDRVTDRLFQLDVEIHVVRAAKFLSMRKDAA